MSWSSNNIDWASTAAVVQAFGVMAALWISVSQGARAEKREVRRQYAAASAAYALVSDIDQTLVGWCGELIASPVVGWSIIERIQASGRLSDFFGALSSFDRTSLPDVVFVDGLIKRRFAFASSSAKSKPGPQDLRRVCGASLKIFEAQRPPWSGRSSCCPRGPSGAPGANGSDSGGEICRGDVVAAQTTTGWEMANALGAWAQAVFTAGAVFVAARLSESHARRAERARRNAKLAALIGLYTEADRVMATMLQMPFAAALTQVEHLSDVERALRAVDVLDLPNAMIASDLFFARRAVTQAPQWLKLAGSGETDLKQQIWSERKTIQTVIERAQGICGKESLGWVIPGAEGRKPPPRSRLLDRLRRLLRAK